MKKPLRAFRRSFWRSLSCFHRPPRHIQIYLCAYQNLESNGCFHTHWTGRPIDLTNRPRVKCIDKLANKVFVRRGVCKWCGSDKVVKNGKNKGQQLFKCKECNHQFFDNGKFPRMRKPKEAVAFALEMYFDGHSLPKIAKNLRKFFGVEVSFQKIHEWIQKYVPQVDGYLSQFKPQLSGIWCADETVLKIRPQTPLTDEDRRKGVRRRGAQYWFWDAIDKETRFLVGSHLSNTRTMDDATAFFRDCARNTPRPKAIVTDELGVYHRGINRVYYSRFKDRRVEHVHASGFGARMNNQLIERFHGTLKDRTKPMRGLVSPDTQVLRGFQIHYNFLRPHTSLGGHTPAESAQVCLPFENGWGDLVRWATYHGTLNASNS